MTIPVDLWKGSTTTGDPTILRPLARKHLLPRPSHRQCGKVGIAMDEDCSTTNGSRGNEAVGQRDPRRCPAPEIKRQIKNGLIDGNDLGDRLAKVYHCLIRAGTRAGAMQTGRPDLEERQHRHADNDFRVPEQGSHPFHPWLAEGTRKSGGRVEYVGHHWW